MHMKVHHQITRAIKDSIGAAFSFDPIYQVFKTHGASYASSEGVLGSTWSRS